MELLLAFSGAILGTRWCRCWHRWSYWIAIFSTVKRETSDYRDNADRIEVERSFSQLKRRFGADLITTKRQDTTLSSILLRVVAMNLSKLTADFLRQFFKCISKIYRTELNSIRTLFV